MWSSYEIILESVEAKKDIQTEQAKVIMEEKTEKPSELKKARVIHCPKCGKEGAVEFVYKDGTVEVQCAYCEPEKYL